MSDWFWVAVSIGMVLGLGALKRVLGARDSHRAVDALPKYDGIRSGVELDASPGSVTGILDQLSQAFQRRFKVREVRNVTILTFDSWLSKDERELMRSGVESITKAGKRGFVCDFSKLDPQVNSSEHLGRLISYYNDLHSAGAKAFCFLHAERFIRKWKEARILGSPPENFDTEADAIEWVLETLRCLVQRERTP